MPKTKFIVKEKKLLKEGKGQWGPWQLVKIVAEDDEEYITFNSDMYAVGNEYEVCYEVKQNGKFESKCLIDKPETKTDKKVKEAVQASKESEEKVLNALRFIYQELQDIKTQLKDMKYAKEDDNFIPPSF